MNAVSFDALMYSYMGLGHGDLPLREKGGQLYSSALVYVQGLLIGDDKPMLARLALTVVVMSMYEAAIDKVMGRAAPHHFCIIRILQYCGPKIFQGAGLLCVFRACTSILVSFVLSTSSHSPPQRVR